MMKNIAGNIFKFCFICNETKKHLTVFRLREYNEGRIVKCSICGHKSFNQTLSKEELQSANYGMYEADTANVDNQKLSWAKKSVDKYIKLLRKHNCVCFNTLVNVGGGGAGLLFESVSRQRL